MTQGRILCVSSNFPRWKGDSTTPFVLHLAKDLQSLGWKVDVLAPHAEGTASIETIDGVSIERFRYFWPASGETVCYQGGALINLRKAKSNYLKLPLLVFCEWLAIRRKLKTGNYSLIHSHWILPQGFTGALAAKSANIPHVLTVHGGDVFGLKGKILSKFKTYALDHADAVTVNSSVTKAAVKTINARAGIKLNKIPMGVSSYVKSKSAPEVQHIRHKYLRGQGPLLLFVGRIVEEKGVGDLIDAVKLLQDTNMDVTCLIVGEGQDRKRFEDKIRDLDLNKQVFFTGWVSPDNLEDYYNACDIFIGPSRTAKDGWKEAQGLTFLEAMMAEVPVIATRSGGIVDSVIDGKTGLLVDENAPEEIRCAAQRLFGETELYKNLAMNGRQHALDNFSREASASAFSSLFKQLLKSKNR